MMFMSSFKSARGALFSRYRGMSHRMTQSVTVEVSSVYQQQNVYNNSTGMTYGMPPGATENAPIRLLMSHGVSIGVTGEALNEQQRSENSSECAAQQMGNVPMDLWMARGVTKCSNVVQQWQQRRGFSSTAAGGSGAQQRREHSSSAAVAVGEERGWLDMAGVKEYLEYRMARCGGLVTHKALLVDAVGTLLVPSEPTAQIYRKIGEKYGVEYSENEILDRYRWAYGQPWGKSRLRYVDDGRAFWKFIVTSSTGCSDSEYFEELYQYYTTDKAWRLCDPEAEKVFQALRKAGVKTAVVSNFDTRLRPLLHALKCDHWFDAVAVSAEVAAEKPNPTIFLKACELLGVNPEDAVHVGDDRRNDLWGARDAGCDAWLWGSDVNSFKEVAQRIGVQV